MNFTLTLPVRFAHVDAAGIVFYPRYFEMLNAAVEEWFAAATGSSFADLHHIRQLGLPTLKLESRFIAPSRLGELLDVSVATERIGRTSCAVGYRIGCGTSDRVIASALLVCMDLATGRAMPWPDDLRSGLEADAKDQRMPPAAM